MCVYVRERALTAIETISAETHMANTCIASNSVDTVSICTALLSPSDTLINVHTGPSISCVTRVT